MSKENKILTPEERAKKHGNEIMGIGIFYLVLYCILIALTISVYLTNPINIIIIGLQVALLIFMIIGGSKKNRTGVKAALAFEIYMIVASVISLILFQRGPDLIGLLVMIFLPFDIKGLSEALNEIESNSNIKNQNDNTNNDIPM